MHFLFASAVFTDRPESQIITRITIEQTETFNHSFTYYCICLNALICCSLRPCAGLFSKRNFILSVFSLVTAFYLCDFAIKSRRGI